MGFQSFCWIFLDPPGSKRFDPGTHRLSLRSACPCNFWVSFLLQVIHLWSNLRSCINLHQVKAWKCLTVSLNPWGPFFGRISELRKLSEDDRDASIKTILKQKVSCHQVKHSESSGATAVIEASDSSWLSHQDFQAPPNLDLVPSG